MSTSPLYRKEDGPSLESNLYLNMTLKYLGPLNPWTLGPLDLGTLGPWDPWTLEPLELGTLGPLPSFNTS